MGRLAVSRVLGVPSSGELISPVYFLVCMGVGLEGLSGGFMVWFRGWGQKSTCRGRKNQKKGGVLGVCCGYGRSGR